jgi:hypothetical protein
MVLAPEPGRGTRLIPRSCSVRGRDVPSCSVVGCLCHRRSTRARLGLDAALPRVLELKAKVGEFGRGERSQNDDFDVIGNGAL